jgi:hypothetical protein
MFVAAASSEQTRECSEKGATMTGVRVRKIVGVVSGATSRLEVQIGILRFGALLDSRCMRSLISQKHFQDLWRANTKLQLEPTEVNCVTASGQNLEILGEIKFPLKIEGFSWKWSFLVSKKLTGHTILGAHFIRKPRMVLELARAKCHFELESHFVWVIDFLRVHPLHHSLGVSHKSRQVIFQRSQLENLVKQYPDY